MIAAFGRREIELGRERFDQTELVAAQASVALESISRRVSVAPAVDSLTGLPGLAQLQVDGPAAIAVSESGGEPCSLVVVDSIASRPTTRPTASQLEMMPSAASAASFDEPSAPTTRLSEVSATCSC